MNMKLLIVLSIKEYQHQVSTLLEESGVSIFSVTDVTGYKKRELNVGWFGVGSGKTNSIVLFSFTDEETANKALDSIDSCNTKKENPFPVRGYLVDVERFSNKKNDGKFLGQQI